MSPSDANYRPFTFKEICEFLRAKETTIRQYCREGMPKFFVGKEARFIPDKVVEWLERRSQDSIVPLAGVFDPGKAKIP